MGDEKDITYILCNRVKDATPKLEGCVKEKCFKCSEEVWVSPSSVEIHEKKGAEYICFPCARPSLKEAKPAQFKILPSQIEEIRDYHRRIISSN